MLQCVAVCCSVLQCVVYVCECTCRCLFELSKSNIAEHCSMLQCVAVCCSVLQCVAVCCSVLCMYVSVHVDVCLNCLNLTYSNQD